MKQGQNVIYYNDELKDEFSSAKIIPKRIDGNYQYEDSSRFGKIKHVLIYRIIARPIAFLYLKIKYHHTIKNKKVLKLAEGEGIFLYGNHTHAVADALIPSMISYPKDADVIVHPNNVSMPVLGGVTPTLGAIPLPDDREATKNFLHIIEKKINDKHCVTIYPEAHIWPYYTHIRPFVDTSFRYAISLKTPVFCFTNTYQKRRFLKTPKIVTYVDGPFYPDTSKSAKEQKIALRDTVYHTMVDRSKKNSIELITYVKAGNTK